MKSKYRQIEVEKQGNRNLKSKLKSKPQKPEVENQRNRNLNQNWSQNIERSSRKPEQLKSEIKTLKNRSRKPKKSRSESKLKSKNRMIEVDNQGNRNLK